MKKIFKNTLIIFILIMSIFTFIGCSNNESNLVNHLSTNFSMIDRKYGKELENAYKQYPENIEICALYLYYNAKYYQQKNNQFDKTINYTIYSQLYLRQINSTYSGVMAKEIYDFGIDLFGSKIEWDKQTLYFNSNYNKLSKDKKIQIITYIKNRFNYYENEYGYYTDDRYTQIVFTETAKEFNFLYEEIDMLWWEYSLNPYPLYLKV